LNRAPKAIDKRLKKPGKLVCWVMVVLIGQCESGDPAHPAPENPAPKRGA
jgi:hypothetical protein